MDRRDGWHKQSNRLKWTVYMSLEQMKVVFTSKKNENLNKNASYVMDISVERCMWIGEDLLSRRHQHIQIHYGCKNLRLRPDWQEGWLYFKKKKN